MVRYCILLVGALAVTPSFAVADDCVVNGTHVSLEHVRVQPAGAGADPLDLDIRDVPVRATIRNRARVDLQITGAIAFTATASKVWWTLAAPAETADRTVSLAAGAHLVDARAAGDSVLAAAVLYASDVMVGEAEDPDEKVGPVRVACDKLTLDWADDGADLETGGDETNWQPRKHGNRLALRAAPNAKAAAITVIAPNCSGAGCLTFERVEHRAGWMLVATANEGVRAQGWVRTSTLVQLPANEGVGRSYMCTGHHGRDEVMTGYMSTTGVVKSAATLKVGTTIYAGKGDGAWATVVASGPYHVRFVRGDTWAELTGIPGVGGAVSAYVPLSAVTLATTTP